MAPLRRAKGFLWSPLPPPHPFFLLTNGFFGRKKTISFLIYPFSFFQRWAKRAGIDLPSVKRKSIVKFLADFPPPLQTICYFRNTCLGRNKEKSYRLKPQESWANSFSSAGRKVFLSQLLRGVGIILETGLASLLQLAACVVIPGAALGSTFERGQFFFPADGRKREKAPIESQYRGSALWKPNILVFP